MKHIEIPDLRLFVGDSEWSGLYADGELVQCGDHYLADEKIREYAGVVTIHDNAFLLGGDGVRPHGPAETLDEIDEFIRDRDSARERAQTMRDKAAALIAEADKVERTFR